MSKTQIYVKIEKVKKNMDQYILSFSSQVCNLPERVPLSKRQQFELSAVLEESKVCSPTLTSADDGSFVAADSLAA